MNDEQRVVVGRLSYASGCAGVRAERLLLIAVCSVYLVLVAGYALVTPYGEAPDEYAHVLYVEHLLRYGRLPSVSPKTDTLESFQPPLYYMLGAAVMAVGKVATGRSIDSGLAPAVARNPDFGKLRKPTGRAALVYVPEARWPVWVFVLRAISALTGLGVILLTWATARILVPPPAPASVPLLSAAFAAYIPQANFIRASVTNENLADLMAAWVVYLSIRHLALPCSNLRPLWLGVALGLGVLSKGSLLALGAIVLWVLWVRRRDSTHGVVWDTVMAGAVAVAISGWFFVHQWITYGDPLADAASRLMIPPNSTWRLTDLFWLQHPFRWYLWSSFWGVFGWQIIYLPEWVYHAFAMLVFLAASGGVYLLAARVLTRTQAHICGLLLAVAVVQYGVLIQWTTYVIAWQGRLLFGALSSISVLIGLGLGGLLAGKGAVRGNMPVPAWRVRLANGFATGLVTALIALNVYSIVWVIYPALNVS